MRLISLLTYLPMLLAAACGGEARPRPRMVETVEGALRFAPPADTVGVVVFLHGCDGLGTDSLFPWQRAWVTHLNDRGFLVVAPNSFAEPRPPVSCEPPWPAKREIYAIRKRQTEYDLGVVLKELPHLPVILWGHSEGAGVANMASWDVDAMITTGYQCGFQNTRRFLVDTTTPLLVIAGTRDRYIDGALRSARITAIEEQCAPALRSRRWRLLVQNDMGHAAPLTRPQLHAALDAFLDDVLSASGAGAKARR